MKTLLALILLASCTSPNNKPLTTVNHFPEMRGCFLLYNLKTNTFDKVIGDEVCKERFPACSSFKVPLAVMAFDAGVLRDEKQTLKWDGQKRFLDAWNQDHNAATWMKESVVWFSQKLTPKIGAKKFQRYLDAFNYGNKDFSAGLTQAWLNSPNAKEGALKISPYEQVEFMKNLWTNKLPVSQRSMELTRQITYLETSPKGFKLHGKTGSNFYDEAKKIQLGWFIAHVGNGEQEYIAVTQINDLRAVETKFFGGYRAKEITKAILTEQGLW